MASPFAPISEILDELRGGRMVVLTDDENRENEGDLVLAAQFTTPQAVTFMLTQARGYMCLSLTEADCDRLELVPQASVNTSVRGTPFTVAIDGHPKHGFTTGVSAKERAQTIKLAIDPSTGPSDFVKPGHINPLRARDGGVLVRTGQTEGSVDLCKLAGLTPAAVIIEIMRDDGEMARVPDLITFCERHGIKMCSVAQVIEHRLGRQRLVSRLRPAGGTPIETAHGTFNLIAYESLVDPLPHLALTVGGVGDLDSEGQPTERAEPTLVRMHRRNLLGDIFGDRGSLSRRGGASTAGESVVSTAEVLSESMRAIQDAGAGVLVYLRPEGAGDDLAQRLLRIRRPKVDPDEPNLARADGAADSGGSIPMNEREFGIGCQILRDLGVSKLRLLTNHATKWPGLEAFGLEIVDRVPVDVRL
jgi:3,4-dihydroxy 2-butanone 4-phosphate synthase / GTP cyclohydrolase II